MKSLRSSVIRWFFLLVILGMAIVLTSCKASPMEEHTPFLEDKVILMKKTDLVPVNLAWVNPDVNAKYYTKARVSPINKQYVLNNTFFESCNIRNWTSTTDKDLTDFITYFEQTLIRHLKDAGVYSERPGKNVVDIDLAIVKIVPGKPILGAVNNLTNLTVFGAMFAPIKMIVLGVTDGPLRSSIAIEGVFRDSLNRKIIIGVFADRRKPPISYFDFNSFMAYGNLRATADDWAEEIAEVFIKHPFATGNKIEGKSHLKFLNY